MPSADSDEGLGGSRWSCPPEALIADVHLVERSFNLVDHPEGGNSRIEKARARKRRNRRLIAVFTVILCLGAGVGIGLHFLLARPTGKTTSEKVEQKSTGKKENRPPRKSEPPGFEISQAMSYIHALGEQIGPRPAGSNREFSASRYIVKNLRESGYVVEEQPFTMSDGYGTRNIIGTRRGTLEGYALIIGAHYDSGPESKGAVDNASGVGVVLELARVFSEKRMPPTLQFVFFGGNRPEATVMEDRLNGSKRFVELLGTAEKRELVGMIAVDCVAQGGYLAARTQETGLQRLRDRILDFAKAKGIPAVALKSTTDSDNIPFENVKIPAVWIEWCESGGERILDDTYASVLPEKVETIGDFLRDFIIGLSSGELKELKY